MTIGMIIGRRRILPPTHPPTVRRMTCWSWCSSVIPPSVAAMIAASTLGMTCSKIYWSSANPRAAISGPAAILPVAASMTTMHVMKPSSRRIRRSLSSASSVPPTDEPST